MKKINMFLAVLALATFASCQKLEMKPEEGKQETAETVKVPMTFSASFEDNVQTKVSIGSIDIDNKTLSLSWKKGDRIAVYDGISPTPNLFTADTDGAKVSFSGTVSGGATQFIAVYPYELSVSMSDFATGAAEAFIPHEQTAVSGSMDPSAFAMVGSATTEAPQFRFRFFGSLLSFSVDFDDVIAVMFSGSRPMSGHFTYNNPVGATGPTSISTINEKSHKDVIIKASDGTALQKGETYYVYVRNTGSSSHSPFEAKLITSDARVAARIGSNPLQLARKTLHPLGEFSNTNVIFGYDRYTVYQAGLDVSIAGVSYNKNNDGAPEATLLANEGLFKTGMNGLIFIEASASVTNTSETTIAGDVVLASNDPAHPATYAYTLGKSLLLKSGSLTMDNLIVDMSVATTSGQFMSKKDNDSNLDSLVLNQCDFKNVSRYIYSPNSSFLQKGVEKIKINGCRIATPAAVQLFLVNSKATTLAGYHDFIFTNNVVYGTGETAVQTQLFSTSATGITDTSFPQTVRMDNNLFYNIASAGYYRIYDIASANINNNIFWAADNTNIGSNVKILRLNKPTSENPADFTGASSHNYCYGTLAEGKKWTISDLKDRGPLSDVTTLDTDPIVSFNQITGEFTLAEDYKTYGPQEQPM
ncbi:MAG: DUF4957 domain-containing protein [Rikenellaceae bacterium]|nr:DUF4957 domain-containing protein [Rikenellaceae bacterium]